MPTQMIGTDPKLWIEANRIKATLLQHGLYVEEKGSYLDIRRYSDEGKGFMFKWPCLTVEEFISVGSVLLTLLNDGEEFCRYILSKYAKEGETGYPKGYSIEAEKHIARVQEEQAKEGGK